MTSDAILIELRSLPGAPDSLRERVRSLPEPQPRFAWTLPRVDLRRVVLVAAPAVVALGIGAAALNGVLTGGQTPSEQQLTYSRGAEHAAGATTTTPVYGALRAAKAAPQATDAQALPPSTTRLNKYNAWLRVRVDEDRLAKSTTRAMQIARGYGGYVSSVDMNTPGQHGTASLVLRVPVTKVEDAVLRLGQLGEVTAQRVRIQDLQRAGERPPARDPQAPGDDRRPRAQGSEGHSDAARAVRALGSKVIARHKDKGARNDGA